MAESSLRVLQKIGWPKHASSAGRRELTRMRGGPREPMRQLAPSTSPWTSIPLTREYHASARAGERGRQFIHESTAASEGLGPMVTAVKLQSRISHCLGSSLSPMRQGRRSGRHNSDFCISSVSSSSCAAVRALPFPPNHRCRSPRLRAGRVPWKFVSTCDLRDLKTIVTAGMTSRLLKNSAAFADET